MKAESGQLTLKAGKATSLNGALMAENFDKKATDDLYSWSSRRAGYLSSANASSAMTARNSGGCTNFLGSGYNSGCWTFNPVFGLYTYLPMLGYGYSPYGYGWWSPATVIYYTPGSGSGYFPGSSATASHIPAQLGASRGSTSPSFPSGVGAARGGGFGGGFGGGGFGGGGMSGGGGGGGMAGGGGGGHAGGGGGGHR